MVGFKLQDSRFILALLNCTSFLMIQKCIMSIMYETTMTKQANSKTNTTNILHQILLKVRKLKIQNQ